MRVTVVRPADLGTAETELWWKFQHSTPEGLNPFLSLTFTQAVGRFRDGARVAVVEDGGEIAAFLPFELSARGLGMPIGYPMNNLQGFIGSGLPIDAKRVVKRARLRGWRFDAVPVEERAFSPFHYAGTTVPCLVIDLAKGLPRSRRREKARRILAEHFGAVSLEWNSTDPVEVDRMIEWKSRRYHGSSLLFSDPTARGIVQELAASAAEDCHGVVGVMRAGERPVLVHVSLHGPDSLAGWFTSYDQELSDFSPGKLLWDPLAGAAKERGLGRIDLGSGQDAYKLSLSNGSYLVAGGAVWVSGAEAAGRKLVRRLRSLSGERKA